MLPGMDIGTQAGNPLPLRCFQMQARHEDLGGRAVLFGTKFMNVPQAQPCARKPGQLANLGAAQRAGPIVVKRILFHAVDTQQQRPRTSLAYTTFCDSAPGSQSGGRAHRSIVGRNDWSHPRFAYAQRVPSATPARPRVCHPLP